MKSAPKSNATPSTRSNMVANLALLGLCLSVCINALIHHAFTGELEVALFVLFLISGFKILRMRELFLLALSVICIGFVWISSAHPALVIMASAQRGAYLCAFITLLSLLRDGASTSSSVLEMGRFLTHQPPGRRYWSISLGGHIMGVIMNFGALSLLTPLIQRGIAHNGDNVDPQIKDLRERRQLNALARGFSSFILWSPTALSQFIAVTIVQGAAQIVIAIYGLTLAILFMITGWLEDRISGKRAARKLDPKSRVTAQKSSIFPRSEFQRLSVVYITLLLTAALFAFSFDLALVTGIILAVLPTTILWIAAQYYRQKNTSPKINGLTFSARMHGLYQKSMPDGSPEAITLGFAGFIGTALATTISPSSVSAYIDLANISPFFIYCALVAIIPIVTNFGLPSLLMVTFLGTFLSTGYGDILNPNLLALSLLAGWTINLTGSQFGGTNLILSRMTSIPPLKLAFQWNGIYSVLCFFITIIVIAVLNIAQF